MQSISLTQFAHALGKTTAEMRLFLQSLYPSGFPRASANETFDILKVLEWVVAQQELQVQITTAMLKQVEVDAK